MSKYARLMRAGVVLAIGCVAVSCVAQQPGRVTLPGRPATAASSAAPAASVAAAGAISIGKTKLIPLVSDSWGPREELVLDKQSTLYVGSSGQRWTVREVPAPLPDDPERTQYLLTGAPMMAPETLIATRRKADGSFVFVGESGATYTAKEPLTDFIGVRAPPEPLRAVAVGKDAIVGITHRDTLLRSIDDGATFAPIALPKTSAIPVSIAGSARSELAILGAPAKVFGSLDDGASFRAVLADGLAPTSVARSANTNAIHFRGYSVSATKPPGLAMAVTAHGILGRLNDAPVLERTTKSANSVFRPINDSDRLELGDAVQTGRAVMHELRYLEVRSENGALLAAQLDNGKVTTTPIAASNDCELVAVVSAKATVIVECLRSIETTKGTREELHFFRSTDFGKTFVSEGMALAGKESQRAVFVSSKGTIFAGGACAAAACAPIITKVPGAKQFGPAKTPPGFAVHRMFASADGERVFALAVGDTDSVPALLVSRDAGKTFAAKPAPVDNADDAQLAYDDATSTLAIFTIGDPAVRHTTRDDGATWDTRDLPFGADWISLAGVRGLATSAGKGYETFDFGATWGAVPLPVSSAGGGTLPIACTPRGCMLGDVALRDGWELQTAADLKPIVRPPPKPPTHLPLVECAPEGDEIEIGSMVEPDVDPTSALTWALAVETAGAVDMVMWPRGGKSVSRVPMLGTPKEASSVRRWVSGDGVIVLRAVRGDGKSPADIDVAWWVSSTNKVFKGTLSKAAPAVGKWGTPSGMAAIVPGHGLYVRPGNSPEPTLYLVKESGGVSKVTINAAFPSYPRMFARRTAKGVVFAGPTNEQLHADRVALFTTLADNGNVTTHAWALWPRAKTRAELAFTGDQLVLTTAGDATMAPRSWALSWKDPTIEPPEPTPLPAGKDVASAAACASTAARVTVPWSAGFRTPYAIKLAKRTLFLATTSTTLRGGDKPCARGVLAGNPNTTMSQEWLLIAAEDPTHGFVFTRGPKGHVMTRVACNKSSAALPAAFTTAKGFL